MPEPNVAAAEADAQPEAGTEADMDAMVAQARMYATAATEAAAAAARFATTASEAQDEAGEAVALDWQAVVDHSDAAVAAAANAESCSRNARAASDLGLSRVRRHGRRRGGGDAAGGGGGRGSARGGC